MSDNARAPLPGRYSSAETLDLLSRARNGGDDALHDLLVHYQDYLLVIARRKLGKRLRECVESIDVVQEANVIALRKLRDLEIRDRKSLLAWLARIVENKIRDHADFHGAQARDMARQVPLAAPAADHSGVEIDLAGAETGPVEKVEVAELEKLIEAGIDRLPEAEREAVRLRRRGRSFEEIAKELGRPTAHAAEVLFYRGRARLKQEYGRTVGEDGR